MGRLRPTVLVVDDQEDLRLLAAALLEEFGFTPLVAAGADEAVRMLEGDFLRIDLLFTDVMMPGSMNGFALAKRARQIRPELRIVLTSGYIDPGLAEAMSREFYPILAKPYRPKQLLGIIAEQFRLQPLAQEDGEPGEPPPGDDGRDEDQPIRRSSGRS